MGTMGNSKLQDGLCPQASLSFGHNVLNVYNHIMEPAHCWLSWGQKCPSPGPRIAIALFQLLPHYVSWDTFLRYWLQLIVTCVTEFALFVSEITEGSRPVALGLTYFGFDFSTSDCQRLWPLAWVEFMAQDCWHLYHWLMEAHGHIFIPDTQNFVQTTLGWIALNFAWHFVLVLFAEYSSECWAYIYCMI